MRIALAQTCPISAPKGTWASQNRGASDLFRDLVKNLELAELHIARAAKEKADVVCFPEYFLEGILNEGRQYLSLTSQFLEKRIAVFAKQYSVAITGTIVHGSSDTLPPLPKSDLVQNYTSDPYDAQSARREWAEYLDSHEEALADDSHFTLINEAFYIDATGKKIGSYTKKNLWHPEREYLEPGKVDEPLFDTPWGKAGFLICWDLSHSAAAQKLADEGADIIFAPAYWLAIDSEPMVSKYTSYPDYELDLVQSLCSARSFETETVCIHVNPGGPRDEGFMGGSGVWAPLMGRVGGFGKDTNDVTEMGVKIVEIDMGVLVDARDTYKIREDYAIRNGT